MRIAVLADVHGNLPAFEAALDHVARQPVDRIILAGDIVVGAPDSKACWKLASELGCPILLGNQERYVAHYGTSRALPIWDTDQFAPLHWAAKQLTDRDREDMGNLPLTLRLPEAPDVVFCHASTRSDNDAIKAHTPEDHKLHEMFSGITERFIVRAHNHIGGIRIWDGRSIITCSSVGLPLDGEPTAQYLLLEKHSSDWQIRHQSVPYDIEAALRRFHDTGYLEATGPMGRLFLRELATASHQIVPFLRAYARWDDNSSISLSEAVDRFLNIY